MNPTALNHWMAIDDGFDFFRVDFETADINDAAMPAKKDVPVVSKFQQISRIHESIFVFEVASFAAEIMRGAAI